MFKERTRLDRVNEWLDPGMLKNIAFRAQAHTQVGPLVAAVALVRDMEIDPLCVQLTLKQTQDRVAAFSFVLHDHGPDLALSDELRFGTRRPGTAFPRSGKAARVIL